MYGIREFRSVCAQRQSFLREQLNWLDEQRRAYEHDIRRLQSELDRVRQELIGHLLPEVNTSYLESLSQRTGCVGLIAVKHHFDEQFLQAEQRRSELDSMDEIIEFDLRSQAMEQEMDALEPDYRRLSRRSSLWERSSHYRALVDRGFFEGTKSFGLWQRFLNWRNVSFLMSYLAKKGEESYATPEEVKDARRTLLSERQVVVPRYDALVQQRASLFALYDEWVELKSAPERILADLYQQLGAKLTTYLAECSDETKLRLAQEDRLLDRHLRREIGMRKQIQYLEELAVVRIDQQRQNLADELRNLDAKMSKLSAQQRRGKAKFFTEEQMRKMGDVRPQKWEKRRRSIEGARQRISAFDNYDSGSFMEQYLWWDLMTGGAAGNDLFEVRQFREQNPDWDYRDRRDPAEESAAIASLDDAAPSLAESMASSYGDDLFADAS